MAKDTQTKSNSDPVPPFAGISQEQWDELPIGSPRRYDYRSYSEVKAQEAALVEAQASAVAPSPSEPENPDGPDTLKNPPVA